MVRTSTTELDQVFLCTLNYGLEDAINANINGVELPGKKSETFY